MSPSHNGSSPPDAAVRRILIVDDEPTLRLGFAYALSGPSTEVETASTGRQALELIQSRSFDIVILDLRMPDLDGLGVIEALRGGEENENRHIPIVLCSAAVTPAAALRAIHHQVVDFLLKPIKPSDLRQVVDFVLNPKSDSLSRALSEIRRGRWHEALQCLAAEREPTQGSRAWKRVLQALLRYTDPDERPQIERIIGSEVALLAFQTADPA